MVELVLLEDDGVGSKSNSRDREILEKYTVEEVATHSTTEDLWIIIHGKIYDVTTYLEDHPGGDQVLLVVAGEDATSDFEEAGHSKDAWKLMEKYCVGEVDVKPTKDQKTRQLLYKTTLSSVVVVGLIAITLFWRRKRRG